MAFDLKNFINTARQQGIPDQQVYQYIQSKNLLPKNSPQMADVPAETMPDPNAPQPGLAQNIGAGLLQSAAGAVKGIGDIGVGATNEVSKLPGMSWLHTDTTGPNSPSQTLGRAATPQNATQGIAKTAGDIAQFFIPGGAEKAAAGKIDGVIDAAKFAEKFGPEAGDALSSILKAVGKGTVMAGSAAGVTAAQTGGDPKATLAGAAAGGLSVPAGKLLESAGEGIAKMFIPKSDAEAGMLQAYKASVPFLDRMKSVLGMADSKAPTTAGKTAFDKGLAGTESMIGVQAKRAQATLWSKLIKPALDQSEAKIDIPSFLKEAEQAMAKNTNDPTRLGVLKNALSAIKDDFKGIGQISLSQLQKYKEGWAEFVPEKAYKGQPIAGALNDVRNTLAGMARQKIYSELGDNVRQAYLDYGNMHSLAAMGRKAMTGAVKGGTGTTLKNLMEMATVPIGTVGGQTVYKVGQGLEIFGRAGATVLRDALGIPTGQADTSTSAQGQ